MFKPPSLKHFSSLFSKKALESKMLLTIATLNGIMDSSLKWVIKQRNTLEMPLNPMLKFIWGLCWSIYIHLEKCTSYKCTALWIFINRPMKPSTRSSDSTIITAPERQWSLKDNHYLDFWLYWLTLFALDINEIKLSWVASFTQHFMC